MKHNQAIKVDIIRIVLNGKAYTLSEASAVCLYNKRLVDTTRSGFYVTVFHLTNIFK